MSPELTRFVISYSYDEAALDNVHAYMVVQCSWGNLKLFIRGQGRGGNF